MSELNQVLGQIRQRISKTTGKRSMNEENTKATLIEPVLRSLGWDIEDVEEVVREYKGRRSDKPVDYALLVLRSPRLFVEAKALGQNLDERKWASQIMGYASVAGVEWIVLTDGDEYRIYNSHATVAVEDKIFRSVRISNEGSLAEETLNLLSKEQMTENRIDVLWKVQFVDRQVEAVIEDLFGLDPDSSLVRLIRKRVQNLPLRDIRSSLSRVQVSLDFPIDGESSGDLRTVRSESIDGKDPASKTGISHSHLIKTGILKPPVQLEKTYKGYRVQATLASDGTIVFDKKRFDSLSAAAGSAKQSILGCAKPPASNGWKFWSCKDENGILRTMDSLRLKYLRLYAQAHTRECRKRPIDNDMY